MDIAPDIFRQLEADFPAAELESRLSQLMEATESERVQRCIVWAARGHPWYFDFLCRMTKVDYRDVIMAAEYDRLGAHLYNFNKPFAEARIDEPY